MVFGPLADGPGHAENMVADDFRVLFDLDQLPPSAPTAAETALRPAAIAGAGRELLARAAERRRNAAT